MSNSLWPHGLQQSQASPTPGACPNSCPSSWWCHPTISSCHPLLLLPSIFPSIRVFSNESVLRIRWPKYCRFSISPSNEYSGLISFRIDWLDLLAVQGILKSLLQHHSSNASILLRSAFFMVQVSHPYVTTGKIIDGPLTRWTFVGKVMSLLFNMLFICYFYLICFFIWYYKYSLLCFFVYPNTFCQNPAWDPTLMHVWSCDLSGQRCGERSLEQRGRFGKFSQESGHEVVRAEVAAWKRR